MKNKAMMQKIIIALLFFLVVSTLTIFGPKTGTNPEVVLLAKATNASSLISQEVTGIQVVPQALYRVYHQNQEIGRLHDIDQIQPLLDKVYETTYKKEFPESKLNLGEDIHITKELSFFTYENIDDKILNFIVQNEFFSVEVTKIIFSNGAEAYVKNLDDFTVAKDRYVLKFIDKSAYTNIQNKVPQPTLTTYGSQDIGIKIEENIEISRGFAPVTKILKNVDEIIYYLSYGYDTVPKYHTVEKYDTVEGIAQMYGLEAEHIVMINSGIKSADQFLDPGSQINVTYYNSPITITVTKEVLRSEPNNPEPTKYIQDSTLLEGVTRTVTEEKVGSDDVRVKEIWVNGVLVDNEIISREMKVAPTQEVVRIGTRVIPGIGTGKFRWPVDYPRITCRWWCYYGHRAIDIQNRYNRYGNIYASDRGTVAENGYTSVNGYYVKINHGNGFLTYYGHMRTKSPLKVGQKIDKGMVIGNIGQTGKATGPHVHFAIEKYGTRLDPCKILGC